MVMTLLTTSLFDIYRKMCDNGTDEFISIMNHVERESVIYFIKCWIKTVGLQRTKIIHILNWVLKGQWNRNHRILPCMIKGWDANLSVILCLCGWRGQRSLCKPRKAWKREGAEREMPNAESDTGQEVLIFQRKKAADLRLRFIHLLNPPIVREHFLCAGVRSPDCGYRHEKAIMNSHVILAVLLSFLVWLPCFLQIISGVYRLWLHLCGFLGFQIYNNV